MSNNIYDILKKMANLEAPKQSLTESKKAKPDYIDIDKDGNKTEPMKKAAKDKAKGGIAEAVARVEQQLSEKYMGFKKTVAAIKKGGSAENPEAVAAAIGRKKYGKEKFQKAAAAGKKLGEGSKDIYNKGIPSQGIVGSGKPDPKELERYLDYHSYQDSAGTHYDQLGNPRQNPDLKNRMDKDRDYPVYELGLPPDRPVPGKMKKGVAEGSYNEDMLSPKQQKIARMAGDPDKIDAKDFAALRGEKKDKKTEGNKFTAGLANDNVKVGEKIPGTNAVKTKDIDEGNDGPEYQKAWTRTQAERKDWEQSHPGEKYYSSPKSPIERHSMEIAKARDADTAAKDAGRSTMGRIANTLSKGLFGQELPEGRTSMREGWEEMQKYLDKKRGPESKGGAGKKAGTRYGGSAQKDDDEDTDGEGKPVEKKKGRPKGTGGGAKFSFKKPKD